MHNPPHPGEILQEQCIKPLGLSITETAKALGISRKNLSKLVNSHISLSPEMAMRLSLAFNTSAEFWLNHQMNYDLFHLNKNIKKFKVGKLAA